MSTMDKATLVDLLESAGYEPRDYSGRGMYGKYCVGVEVERGDFEFTMGVRLCKAALELAESNGNDEDVFGEACRLINQIEDLSVATDSLGLGTIVYFPRVKWEE